MKFSAAIFALAAVVHSKEMPKDLERAKLYDSGEIHEAIMAAKEAVWASQREMGVMNAADGPPVSRVALRAVQGRQGDPLS